VLFVCYRYCLIVTVLTGVQLVGNQNATISEFLTWIALGLVHPTLPNGGWSITVEFHFYLMLPILLLLMYQSRWTLVALIALSTAIRTILYARYEEVQFWSYLTIIGRIDQFVLGMLAFNLRSFFSFQHALAISIIVAFGAFYWFFDIKGGFYNMPTYPSPAALWILMPTIEGAAYGLLIAWYDGSFRFAKTGLSKFVSLFGTYSYSIYLLHFFIVFEVADLIQEHVMDISNFYIALLWSFAFYISMMPIGYLSFRFIESPFLKLRIPYTKPIKG
jgi:peptidoglycan/LPS O-acetylase OafA/YrhL